MQLRNTREAPLSSKQFQRADRFFSLWLRDGLGGLNVGADLEGNVQELIVDGGEPPQEGGRDVEQCS